MLTINEIAANLHDPEWRFRNLYHISQCGGDVVKFKPNETQIALFQLSDTGARFLINQHERRKGVTTAMVLRLLDKAIFSPNERCVVVTQYPDLIIQEVVDPAIKGLLEPLREQMYDHTDQVFRFANGSILQVSDNVRGAATTQVFVHWIEDIEDKFKTLAWDVAIATPECGNVFISGNEFLHPESTFQDMVKAAKNGENGYTVLEVV